MTFFTAIFIKRGDFSRCSAQRGFEQQFRKAVVHAEDRCEILDPRHFGTATRKSLILDGTGLFFFFRLEGCSAFDSSRLRREEILDLRRFKTADLESIMAACQVRSYLTRGWKVVKVTKNFHEI